MRSVPVTINLTEDEIVLLSQALQWSIDFYLMRERTLKTPLVREQCRAMAASLGLIRSKFLNAAPGEGE